MTKQTHKVPGTHIRIAYDRDAVHPGFRMAMEHISRPPPRDAYERIVREAHERLDKLLKHTHIRMAFIAADDYARGRVAGVNKP